MRPASGCLRPLVSARRGIDVGEQCGDREGHATFLYDEAGHRIESDERLTALIENARDDLWVLPALALHRTQNGDDEDSESPHRQGPKRMDLTCHECDQDTTHQFHGTDDVPDEVWSGQPIWECRVCGVTRYGPAPDDIQ